jgi:hypothetical protein
MSESQPSVSNLAVEACKETPKPLAPIYDFVRRYRPETAEETIRARIYEAMEQGKITRVARGVYFARSGPAQLLLIEGDGWDVMSKLEDGCVSLLISDPPGKFGREWAGMGTTRPHVQLGGRTYQQPELDRAFFEQAFRILDKKREWNTLSKEKRERGEFPRGGAACIIRVPIENRTTRPHIQAMIQLAASLGFVYYGEVPIVLDKLGMGYDAGRDLGSKWIVMCAGPRNGVLWDLSVPNVIDAKRIRNPAKLGAVEHEAEKDPVEFTEMLKAYSRKGDVVLDPFAGRARWVKWALAAGRHVIIGDIDGVWPDRIAAEDFGFTEPN